MLTRITLVSCFGLFVIAQAHASCPSPVTVRDGNGQVQSVEAINDASNNCEFVNVIGDGGGAANKAAVKAASTAPAATDPALVVAISPNSPALPPGCAGALVANTKVANIDLTASGRIVVGTASKQTYVCAVDISVSTADNVALVEGSGSTCGTSTLAMAGGTSAGHGWNFVANTGLTKGNGQGIVALTTTQADDVCLLVSTGAQVSGSVTYTQF